MQDPLSLPLVYVLGAIQLSISFPHLTNNNSTDASAIKVTRSKQANTQTTGTKVDGASSFGEVGCSWSQNEHLIEVESASKRHLNIPIRAKSIT